MQGKQHSDEQKRGDTSSTQHVISQTRPTQGIQHKPVVAHAYQRVSGNSQPRTHSPADMLTLQRSIGNQAVQRLLARTTQRETEPIQRKANNTGLPDTLKAGIESLSGISMDHARVHYNSSKPAQLQALAHTKGTDIYVGPGQERHLGHEAWHVVQQMQGRVQPTMQMKGVAINDDQGLEREADVMGAKALQVPGSAHRRRGGDGPPEVGGQNGVGKVPSTQLRGTGGEGNVIQRAIGLEIEIPVPIDQLTPAEVTAINNQVTLAETTNPPAGALLHPAKSDAKTIRDTNGTVHYGIIRASHEGFRVDADHDDRVQTPDPFTTGWPLPEGGRDSIMEIVMDPPAVDIATFTDTMNNINNFINQINTQTANLTTRWVNAFPNVSIGPMDYSGLGLGFHRQRRPHHNFQGSIQVNIGIDPREYHSLIKWYASSDYAKARNVPENERELYWQIKTDIRLAVNIGRTITQNIYNAMTPLERQQTGNLRGLRGWITHLALYLKRGTIPSGTLGGTVKNIAPILLKSPNTILAQYGMTPDEQTYFNAHKTAIMDEVLRRTERPNDTSIHQPLNAVEAFAASPGQINADALSDLASAGVPLTGGPLNNPTGVGPQRTGNAAVQNLPQVPTGNIGGGPNTRGGVVLEFRTLPGYYDGVESWRVLGLAFLKAAEERNKRSG